MQLRILHTNMHRGGWGGQPNRILLLSKGLKERGHFVIIAAPKGATLIKRAREEGIPTYDDLEFPKKFKPHVILKEIIKLKKLIERENIQIVHTHGSQDTWAATIAAKLSRNRPVVIRTRHNTFPVANHPGNRILYRCMIDYIILVSQGILDTYKRTGVLGNKIEKCSVIYSVVDPKRFENCKEEARAVREEFILNNKTFVFTKIGRLAKEKGYDKYIETCRLIQNRCKSVCFAIGEGPMKDSLEKLASTYGLQITFTGLRKDVCGFLRNSDVFIFTPIAGESLGTVNTEALYNRIPVVSFEYPGANSVIENGKNGFIVKEKSPAKSAKYAVFIATDRKTRRKISTSGRRKIERQFLVDSLITKTEGLYICTMRGRNTAPTTN